MTACFVSLHLGSVHMCLGMASVRFFEGVWCSFVHWLRCKFLKCVTLENTPEPDLKLYRTLEKWTAAVPDICEPAP